MRRIVALLLTSVLTTLVAGAQPAGGQSAETSSPARSLVAVIGDNPNHPFFVGVVTAPAVVVAFIAYSEDPVGARVAAAFTGAPARTAAREGTVVCVSSIAAGMDRSGRPFDFGVARILLDEPIADGVQPALLGGGLDGPLTMVDVRSRAAAATARGDSVPLTGFGDARFPLLVAVPEARRLDLFSAVFDVRQRLAGFALPYAGEAARGDIAFVSLVVPRTDCLQ